MPALSRRLAILSALALALHGLARAAGAAPDWQAHPWQMMMVGSESCHYCRRWQAEIGPGYAASDAGQAAPLFEVDVDGPYPDGLALARRPWITPTFVLLSDGSEAGRIEGYVGERHFYPVLEEMMRGAGLTLHA